MTIIVKNSGGAGESGESDGTNGGKDEQGIGAQEQ